MNTIACNAPWKDLKNRCPRCCKTTPCEVLREYSQQAEADRDKWKKIAELAVEELADISCNFLVDPCLLMKGSQNGCRYGVCSNATCPENWKIHLQKQVEE